MKALIHEGEVKFLLEDDDNVIAEGAGIRICTKVEKGNPDVIVGDIPFADVQVIERAPAHLIPGFFGGKFLYKNGTFVVAGKK